MTQGESKLSRDIMRALRQRGAFVWKNHGGPTMMSGLPDIAGVYLGYFLAIETKMPEGGDPSAIQRLRHDDIRKAGGIVKVARSVAEALTVLMHIDTHIIFRSCAYGDPGGPCVKRIPAGTLEVGDVIQLRAQGTLS